MLALDSFCCVLVHHFPNGMLTSGHGKQPGDKVSAVVAGTKDQSNQATSAKRDSFAGDEEEKEYSSSTVTSTREKHTGGSIQPKRRYILFVGHLPYEATAEDIVDHFEKRGVQVKNLRLLTKKETGKSRGIAFVEFDSPKMMQVGSFVLPPLPNTTLGEGVEMRQG